MKNLNRATGKGGKIVALSQSPKPAKNTDGKTRNTKPSVGGWYQLPRIQIGASVLDEIRKRARKERCRFDEMMAIVVRWGICELRLDDERKLKENMARIVVPNPAN